MMLCIHIVYEFRPYLMSCFSLRKCSMLLISEARRHKIRCFRPTVSIENHRQMWEVFDKQNKIRVHWVLNRDQSFANSFAILKQEANIRDSCFPLIKSIYTLMLVYCKFKYFDFTKSSQTIILSTELFFLKPL